jgi:rare lipoprotein A
MFVSRSGEEPQMNAKTMTGFAIWLIASDAACADSSSNYSGRPRADNEPLIEQHGIASYYADFFGGRKTANGEIFRQDRLTAASLDLPLGTMVTVTNDINGKSVDVKVNDRGPYVDGRIIDLSKSAAERIGMKEQGIAPVKVEARPSSQPTEALRQVVGATAAQQDTHRRALARADPHHQGDQAIKSPPKDDEAAAYPAASDARRARDQGVVMPMGGFERRERV